MKITLLQAAAIIAILQALLLAMFFFKNKKSCRTSNVAIASMLLIFAFMNAAILFYRIVPIKFDYQQRKLLFFTGQLAFLIGPLLYFYVKSLLHIDLPLRKRDWLHGLPFALAIACSIPIVQQYNHYYVYQYPCRAYFNGAALIQTFCYFIASFKILHSYGLTLSSFLKYIDNSKLAWVRYFISGYIILWSIQMQVFMTWDIFHTLSWCPYTTNSYFIAAFLFFNGMVYGALKRPELFHQKKKYPHSVLKESEKGLFQRKLTLFLSQEKPYLNPSLSLIDIAQKLDIAPRYVSQIINETFRQNFHDFVNTYRIEESKRLLSHQHQPLNILGIAFQAGFSSKSAFNNAFKKHTGMTPKEYRKQQILASKSRTSVPSPKLFYPPPAILPFHKLSKKMS